MQPVTFLKENPAAAMRTGFLFFIYRITKLQPL